MSDIRCQMTIRAVVGKGRQKGSDSDSSDIEFIWFVIK